MDVEKQFIEYKKLILNATLEVQRFWEGLSSVQPELEDLMRIGNKIVYSYVQQKETYDKLLELKPDYAEAAQYNV